MKLIHKLAALVEADANTLILQLKKGRASLQVGAKNIVSAAQGYFSQRAYRHAANARKIDTHPFILTARTLK